jgi:hypothetical protein
MICLELQNFNQGNGSASAFAPMNPQPSDFSTCSYVLPSGGEVGSSFMSMTSDQGAQLAMAIAMIWAIGAIFRILIDLLRTSATDITEHS